jgi:hypothetical protein
VVERNGNGPTSEASVLKSKVVDKVFDKDEEDQDGDEESEEPLETSTEF